MTSTELVRRQSLSDKILYAEKLAQAGLLPEAYRRQPANVLYAVEYGEMLGIPPMAAINGIHIIKGKPTASAGLIASLVRCAGHRLRMGYDAEKQMGWAEIVRCDDPDFTFRSEWTIDRAVTAGLCEVRNGKPYARDKDGKPTSWEKYPQQMPKHRALTECARDACEEALNGVHYTPEELGEDVDAEGEPIKVTAERVDQAESSVNSSEVPNGAASRGEPEQIDWDARIEQVKDDVEALKKLWTLAKGIEPNNLTLLERIAAAGNAAKAAAEKAAGPVDDGIVDAEIVDEPAPPEEPRDEPAPDPQVPMINKAQMAALHASLNAFGVKDREDKLRACSLIAERPIDSSAKLTAADAKTILDLLDRLSSRGDKARALDTVLAELEVADQQKQGGA